MTLVPCSGCKRHVAVDATDCPFCGAPRSAERTAPRPPLFATRLSRAAVFAGATLAGCWTSAGRNPQAPPPPPPDDLQHEQQVAPPPPPDDTAFAKPPPDSTTTQQQQQQQQQKQPVGTGELWGQVTLDPGHRIARNTDVRIYTLGRLAGRTVTDRDGKYVFRDLPDGEYMLVVAQPDPPNPHHDPLPPIQQKVRIANGGKTRVDVTVNEPPVVIDRGPCCKPYGAPPARRRVV